MTGQPPGGYPPPPSGQEPYGQPQPHQNPPGQPQAQSFGYQPYVPGSTPDSRGNDQVSYQGGLNASSDDNKLATWALISGCLIFTCGILSGIPAIVLGLLARKKAKELGGAGQGKATAAIVLGSISVTLFLVYILLVVTGFVHINISSTANKTDGAAVTANDAAIQNEHVEVSNEGKAVYTAEIINNSNFETAYIVRVKCSTTSQEKMATVQTKKAKPDGVVEVQAGVQLDPQGTTTIVTCIPESITFKK